MSIGVSGQRGTATFARIRDKHAAVTADIERSARHYVSRAVVVRLEVPEWAARPGSNDVPRPGPGGGAMWPSAMRGSSVTTSVYQPV